MSWPRWPFFTPLLRSYSWGSHETTCMIFFLFLFIWGLNLEEWFFSITVCMLGLTVSHLLVVGGKWGREKALCLAGHKYCSPTSAYFHISRMWPFLSGAVPCTLRKSSWLPLACTVLISVSYRTSEREPQEVYSVWRHKTLGLDLLSTSAECKMSHCDLFPRLFPNMIFMKIVPPAHYALSL